MSGSTGRDRGITVHPSAVVEEGAVLGERVEIGPFCVIGPEVVLGAGTRVMAGAQIQGRTTLGEDNVVFPGAVLGCSPQDKKFAGEPTRLEIGSRNHFRENTTIHIGTSVEHGGAEATIIGDDNLFMAGSHIAHDCRIGDRITLGNNTLIAGHVHIESGATISGNSGVHQFVSVGRLAYVGGLSRIAMDVPPFLIWEGRPGRVRGPNVIGLRRVGTPRSSIEELKEAYRLLYHGETLEAGLEELEARDRLCPEVRHLVDFLRRTERGVRGRYLESLRKDRENGNGLPESSAMVDTGACGDLPAPGGKPD